MLRCWTCTTSNKLKSGLALTKIDFSDSRCFRLSIQKGTEMIFIRKTCLLVVVSILHVRFIFFTIRCQVTMGNSTASHCAGPSVVSLGVLIVSHPRTCRLTCFDFSDHLRAFFLRGSVLFLTKFGRLSFLVLKSRLSKCESELRLPLHSGRCFQLTDALFYLWLLLWLDEFWSTRASN